MKIGEIELQPMQIEAVEKFKNVEAVLVADDTGAGKTVTCIALVQQIWDQGEVGPVLIVTKSFAVWIEHLLLMGIEEERIHVIDRTRRSPFVQQLNMIEHNPKKIHFYIMHWEALPLGDMVPVLHRIRWLCVIGDEAHKAKNRKAQRTKSLKRLKTRFKIAATATPGDNATPDIWSLLNWLYPKKYTSYWRWVKHYVECTEHWKGYTVYGGPIVEHIPEFQAEIEPFYICRSLSEVDSSVSEMVYSSVEINMGLLQECAYRDILKEQMAWLGDDLLIAGTQLEASQRMHQLANAYGHLEIGKRWKVINGERVQVDKFSVRLTEPSSKIDILMEILEGEWFTIFGDVPDAFRSSIVNATFIPEDEPIVIFTTYRDMVDIACNRMKETGISYVSAMGGSELTADEAAAIFQRGDVRVFIGTADTIGESITLTRARVCIYIDVHWSPRVKKQCDGRIRRIGQTRVPWAIDIKTRDTVDFVKLDKVRTKAAWINAMLGKED
jgi:SNF2 family DNA or RNA helicase